MCFCVGVLDKKKGSDILPIAWPFVCMYDDLFKRSTDVTFEFRRLLPQKRLRNRNINGKRCLTVGNVIFLGYRYEKSGEKRSEKCSFGRSWRKILQFARELSVFAKKDWSRGKCMYWIKCSDTHKVDYGLYLSRSVKRRSDDHIPEDASVLRYFEPRTVSFNDYSLRSILLW